MTGDESKLPMGRRWPRVLAIVLMGMLGIFQYARLAQPVNRTHRLMWDFSIVYSASRAMILGKDPFQLKNLYSVWEAEPHWKILAPGDRSALGIWVSVNSPPTLVMVAPLAAMGSAAAHGVWIASDVVLLVLMIVALWQLAGLSSASDRLLLVTGMLASEPVVTILRNGQLGFPACAGVVLGIWAVVRKRPILAGVILGLATAVKFQVAGPFILFYLLVRRWRVAMVALGVFAAVCLVAIALLEMHHVPWLSEWRTNVAQSLGRGTVNDPRPGGPGRDTEINLQPALYGLTNNDLTVMTATGICCGLLSMAFLVGVWRSGGRVNDLLALSCVVLLSCLPAYRRTYDLTLLAMLLAWAIAALGTPRRRWPIIVTLVLLAEFMVPTDIILEHLPKLVTRFGQTSWWQTIVVPRHAWTVLLLAAWTTGLFVALAKRAGQDPDDRGRQSVWWSSGPRAAPSPANVQRDGLTSA
ncbi:MAG TPA: glycosyltransferase family 87 protein [Tepidisphaeraceae bacterium]|jgi:hypothetical protein|nr:glycosyltransferase family 87 protein [Tepidisphaeraceae bacterium]